METKIHTHSDEIMQSFSNIAAHLHMAEGWIDSAFPYKVMIHQFDPAIMPQMIKARGEMKILLKRFSKFLRDDDEAIDIMYQHIGKSVALLATLPLQKRKALVEEINELTMRYLEGIEANN